VTSDTDRLVEEVMRATIVRKEHQAKCRRDALERYSRTLGRDMELSDAIEFHDTVYPLMQRLKEL
jgi:hypothetical protein